MLQSHAERRRHAKWRVDFAVHEAIELARRRQVVNPFLVLLDVITSRTDLLRADAVRRPFEAPAVLRALLAFAENTREWVRAPGEWDSHESTPARQYHSFVQHLLAPKPVPEFLARIWTEPFGERAIRHRKVFKHVAAGFGIRGADVPLRLTRGMARFVDDVPPHLSVEEAVRWCQVRGLGGDADLASAIADSHLGVDFHDGQYWENVIGELVRRDVPPRFARFALACGRRDKSVFPCRGRERMSNRDFGRLRSCVVAYEARLKKASGQPWRRWRSTGIHGFREFDDQPNPWSGRTWAISEILDYGNLVAEGRSMQHCVSSYFIRCKLGITSIWSMRHEGILDGDRVLTIEVRPRSRRIVTALGYCNRRPRPDERRVLETWAGRAGLTVSPYV